jgi:hypothetical protein
MAVGKEWQFLCTQHCKKLRKYYPIDYVSHNVNTTITILLILPSTQTDSK